MRTDGVVLGTLTPYGDHTHLEYVCPACGSSGSTAGENSPWRIVCSKTGREFLVVGIFRRTSPAPNPVLRLPWRHNKKATDSRSAAELERLA